MSLLEIIENCNDSDDQSTRSLFFNADKQNFEDNEDIYGNEYDDDISSASSFEDDQQLQRSSSFPINISSNSAVVLDAENILSEKSIREAIFTRCCNNNCMHKLSANHENGDYRESFDIIRELRTEIAKATKVQRLNIIIKNLQKHYTQKPKRNKFGYYIKGFKICPIAFEHAYDITNFTRRSLLRKVISNCVISEDNHKKRKFGDNLMPDEAIVKKLETVMFKEHNILFSHSSLANMRISNSGSVGLVCEVYLYSISRIDINTFVG